MDQFNLTFNFLYSFLGLANKQNILSVRSSAALNAQLNCADAKVKVSGAEPGNARQLQTQCDTDTMQESKGQCISSHFKCTVCFGKQ